MTEEKGTLAQIGETKMKGDVMSVERAVEAVEDEMLTIMANEITTVGTDIGGKTEGRHQSMETTKVLLKTLLQGRRACIQTEGIEVVTTP